MQLRKLIQALWTTKKKKKGRIKSGTLFIMVKMTCSPKVEGIHCNQLANK